MLKPRFHSGRLTVIAAGCLTMMAAGSGSRAAESIDFVRDVQPIFQSHCIKCHGPKKHEAGLRFDSLPSLLKGGDGGEVVAVGKSAESRLIHAVTGTNDVSAMPPEGPKLTAAQIATLRRWIDAGAKGPIATTVDPRAKHWSFQPLRRSAPPAVKQKDWIRNPIDQFILARLEKERIRPSPEADRVTLARRLSLDLLGLPPTIEQVDAFVHDRDPDAYERYVQQLLDSPHYGERWARHWLDMARYADSNGYTIDAPRSIWKYRDWLIGAYNRDLPFDQFVIEQLAGDLLPGATLDQKIATGFHRNTMINGEGGTDPEQFRIEAVVDRVNTTGSVFLGLTIGCAQCHTHKYDPITHKEYYQFFAFFNNADEPTLDVPTNEQEALKREIDLDVTEARRALKLRETELAGEQADWETALKKRMPADLPLDIKEILATVAEKRSEREKKRLVKFHQDKDKGYPELAQKLAVVMKRSSAIATTMVMAERKEPRPTFIHLRGDFLRKGQPVTPDVPAVLPRLSAGGRRSRLDLARWLVSRDNPLTARVTVNRTWQRFFGRGLVETDNDFGTQGALPTHPELLDWLSSEFMARGWSTKTMDKLIVCSATYRQSSKSRPDLNTIDPINKLLARQHRLRVEAEVIRDCALASSGLLSEKIGGPSVFPHQPDGVMALAQVNRPWNLSPGPDRFRRGLYTYFWRSTPHPFLKLFDAADAQTACTRRSRSNTPLQALTLLNDEAFVEFARGLAERVLRDCRPTVGQAFQPAVRPAGGVAIQHHNGDVQRLEYAFRLCVARPPKLVEQERLAVLLREFQRDFTNDPVSARIVAGCDSGNLAERAAWTQVARVLLNLDETVTRE